MFFFAFLIGSRASAAASQHDYRIQRRPFDLISDFATSSVQVQFTSKHRPSGPQRNFAAEMGPVEGDQSTRCRHLQQQHTLQTIRWPSGSLRCSGWNTEAAAFLWLKLTIPGVLNMIIRYYQVANTNRHGKARQSRQCLRAQCPIEEAICAQLPKVFKTRILKGQTSYHMWDLCWMWRKKNEKGTTPLKHRPSLYKIFSLASAKLQQFPTAFLAEPAAGYQAPSRQ